MWKGQQEIISQHAPGAGDKLSETVRAAAHSLARLTTLIKLSCCFLAFSAAAHTRLEDSARLWGQDAFISANINQQPCALERAPRARGISTQRKRDACKCAGAAEC